jgi:hypothetical protein|tara:strand:+ start:309 stop:494 length:186 start_codon:yes stop_codon:yes gene_type:complete
MDIIRELKDKAIGILIELRQQLAKAEGIEEWEQDSQDTVIQTILWEITSGDIQEIIWGLDE